MDILEILRKPLLTEKGTLLQEQNKYMFHVSPKANKPQIREAVEKAFDVKVVAVNVTMVRGKTKRRGIRWVKTSGWKKAIVTLQPGQKIPVFEAG